MDSTEKKIINTWYLENSVTGNKIQITEQRSVHDILDTFLPEERKDWFLTFGSLEELDKEAQITDASQVAEIKFPDGTSQIFFDDSLSERRSAPRIDLNFKVVIVSGNRIFRTTTSNISLGGLMLSVKPPRDYSHPELKVLIEKRDGTKSLLFKATFIPNSSQQRLKFEDVSLSDQEELVDWIQSEVDPSQKEADYKLSA